MSANSTAIRYFIEGNFGDEVDYTDEDTGEVEQHEFQRHYRDTQGRASIEYEKHTVAENGVDQVCLTLTDW